MEEGKKNNKLYSPYFGPFEEGEDTDDKAHIEDGEPVPCRICEEVFGRIRLTWRFCIKCHQGFCQGEHGTFGSGPGFCLKHWAFKQ